jgi:hypothetical protein
LEVEPLEEDACYKEIVEDGLTSEDSFQKQFKAQDNQEITFPPGIEHPKQTISYRGEMQLEFADKCGQTWWMNTWPGLAHECLAERTVAPSKNG